MKYEDSVYVSQAFQKDVEPHRILSRLSSVLDVQFCSRLKRKSLVSL